MPESLKEVFNLCVKVSWQLGTQEQNYTNGGIMSFYFLQNHDFAYFYPKT